MLYSGPRTLPDPSKAVPFLPLTLHSHPGAAPWHTGFWTHVGDPMGDALWMPPPCHPAGDRVTALAALLFGPGPVPQQLDHVSQKAPCQKPGFHRAACPRLGLRTSPGLMREQEGTHHPPILLRGTMVKVMLPGGGGLVADGLQAFRSPIWAVATTPTPSFPAQTLHPTLSGCLRDSHAWSEGIWGQEARSDPGHTPASFLWFLSDIRRGLKNFPQGRGSPECGFSSWAGFRVQGGPQRGRRCAV